MLSFERKFMLPRNKVYTKDGRPKKFDITNRIKALDDCICDAIGIDDRHIFQSYSEKLVGEVIEPIVSVKIEARI